MIFGEEGVCELGVCGGFVGVDTGAEHGDGQGRLGGRGGEQQAEPARRAPGVLTGFCLGRMHGTRVSRRFSDLVAGGWTRCREVPCGCPCVCPPCSIRKRTEIRRPTRMAHGARGTCLSSELLS